jgi:hypothetical protein
MPPIAAKRRRFEQKLFQNVGLSRAERFSDADFLCAFGNGDEHNIHNHDRAD